MERRRPRKGYPPSINGVAETITPRDARVGLGHRECVSGRRELGGRLGLGLCRTLESRGRV